MIEVPQRRVLIADAGAQAAGALVAGVVERQRPSARLQLAHRHAGLDIALLRAGLERQRELSGRVLVRELDLRIDAAHPRRLAFAQARDSAPNVRFAELAIAGDVDT